MEEIDADGGGTIDVAEFLDACDLWSRRSLGKPDRVVTKSLSRTGVDLIFQDWPSAPPLSVTRLNDFNMVQNGMA